MIGSPRQGEKKRNVVVAKQSCKCAPPPWEFQSSILNILAQGMTRYENRTFENQHVILDDGVFVNCTFKNCSLEYSGGDVYVQNCQGESCQLVWRGSAQRTIFLLQGLGLLAPAASLPTAETSSRVQ